MMRNTLTLLALLALATCVFAATAPVDTKASMANSVAITAVNFDVGMTAVISNQAFENPATVAGIEKNSYAYKMTMTASMAMIPANTWTRPAPAVNVIWPQAANTTPAAGAGHRNTELCNLKL